MKLIYCPDCDDVQKLVPLMKRKCICGNSWGYYYEDGLDAAIGGKAIPIGFNNQDLLRALKNRPQDGMGERFEAFVIPIECPTITQK